MNYAPADFHLTKSSKFCFYSKIEFLFNNKNLIQDTKIAFLIEVPVSTKTGEFNRHPFDGKVRGNNKKHCM